MACNDRLKSQAIKKIHSPRYFNVILRVLTLTKVGLPSGSLYLKGHKAKVLQISHEKRKFATYWL